MVNIPAVTPEGGGGGSKLTTGKIEWSSSNTKVSVKESVVNYICFVFLIMSYILFAENEI